MRPTRLEHTIEIDQPVPEVFAFVADPRNDPRWCPRVTSCEQRDGRGVVAGARFESTHHPTLQRRHSRWIEILEIVPHERIRTRQEDNIGIFTIDYLVAPTARGSLLTQRDEIAWKGTPVHRAVGTRVIRRHMRSQLESLKRLLEGERDPSLGEGAAATGDLPYIDEHRIEIEASPAQVWTALVQNLGGPSSRLTRAGARVLRAEEGADGSPAGFKVVHAREPSELVLAGRHRFARYALIFRLEGDVERTSLCAQTRASFPGRSGRAYRALVIGTRTHVLAVGRLLREIRRTTYRNRTRSTTPYSVPTA
jgi:uncharacterized protein YndB with AHSA1/START domain